MFPKSKLLPAVITFTLCYAILHLAIFFVMQPGSGPYLWMETQLGKNPLEWLALLFIVQEVILLCLVVLQFRVYAHHVHWKNIVHFFKEQLHWKWWKLALHVVGWALLMYFVINTILLIIIQMYGIHIPGLFGEQLIVSALSELPLTTWWQKVLLFLGVGIIGPFVEEIMYRGFLTKLLTQAVGARWVIIAAALFALSHMEWGVVRNLFILALLLWYVYHKTQSMRYSFLFHVVINSMALGVLFFAEGIQ